MKKKILSLVLAMVLVAGCVSVFADELQLGPNGTNTYNFKETEGETKVILNCNEYWQWTVPETVLIDFTTREGGVEFGDITISNFVLASDKVITVAVDTISDLVLKDTYLKEGQGLINMTAEDYEKLSGDAKTGVTKVEDKIVAYTDWGLQREVAVPATENGNYDGKNGYISYTGDKRGAAPCYTDKIVEVKAGDVLVAARSNIATGEIYQLSDVCDKENVALQDVMTYNLKGDKADKNDVKAVLLEGKSVVNGSIQGCTAKAVTNAKYYCWGTPSYIGVYEGKVTYTMKNAAIAPIAEYPISLTPPTRG